MRHSVVSLLSDEGVPVEQIARLSGHAGGSAVTETVHREQLRPVIDEGATAMNRVVGTQRPNPAARGPEQPGPQAR